MCHFDSIRFNQPLHQLSLRHCWTVLLLTTEFNAILVGEAPTFRCARHGIRGHCAVEIEWKMVEGGGGKGKQTWE